MAALNSGLIYLAVLGVIASVISAFYYLRIIKIMYFDDSQIVYHSYFSKKTTLILFISIVLVSLFILYPSFIINISSNISLSFFIINS